MKLNAVFMLLLLSTLFARSQENGTSSPILFIYDASGSMWAQMEGKTRMEIARNVLSSSVNNLPENQKIGLMAYGHRVKGDCEDVEFLAGIDNGNKEKITTALTSIKPLGMTPLAYSAKLAIDELRKSKVKATIILITDGIESCGGNICDVISSAKKEGIDFKLHIIGFGLKESETEQLKCAASAGEGNYYDAADAGGLGDVLNKAVDQTIDKPKANVTVYAVKNGVAIDALVKAYDIIAKRNPISVRTYRDTAFVFLPPGTYNFEATPLEGSDIKMVTVANVQSFEDKIVHQDVSFDGGKVAVTTTNNGENWDCAVKLIDQDGKVVASVRTYQEPKEMEVNPGTYNISIQALAIEGVETFTEIKNIEIKANAITPVSYNFKTGKAVIEALADGKSIDSVVNINEISTGKNVSGARTYGREREFVLNPGKYRVKMSPLGDYKDRNPQTFTIEVKQRETISKKVNF